MFARLPLRLFEDVEESILDTEKALDHFELAVPPRLHILEKGVTIAGLSTHNLHLCHIQGVHKEVTGVVEGHNLLQVCDEVGDALLVQHFILEDICKVVTHLLVITHSNSNYSILYFLI